MGLRFANFPSPCRRIYWSDSAPLGAKEHLLACANGCVSLFARFCPVRPTEVVGSWLYDNSEILTFLKITAVVPVGDTCDCAKAPSEGSGASTVEIQTMQMPTRVLLMNEHFPRREVKPRTTNTRTARKTKPLSV